MVPTMVKSNFWCSAVLLALLVVVCGCRGANDGLGSVSGRITLDGEPLPNAMVEFAPVNGGSVAYGRTDDDGDYEMMFSRTQEGASIGENIVRITTADVTSENGNEVAVPERVPAKFNRESELKRTVEPGDNEFNFELTSEGDVASPQNLDQ
ncbi:hypothetical protein Mal4_23290 [Maioricimonas rarisocia]|uniref:Nickel uptake substrate-specific transmembrane region n=1 Tax=Maioricimonas rarisocia TaxID=2528026 RepID=A0A517Z6E4_9PLAN|nr:carboxypeptidase-like regulatory domain-containing protein [Maioricimonas rarisocia]QDU38009.1 hypothetical protein Mal4_23290 [Maioricimonas rarisocia]